MKQKYYLCDLLNKDSEFYKALINIGVSEDLTSEDMNEREQLAIDISNIITDSLFDKFGSEYLYNELFKDKFRKHNNNTLISFKKQENHIIFNYEDLSKEDKNLIWWWLLDIVEDYMMKIVDEREAKNNV